MYKSAFARLENPSPVSRVAAETGAESAAVSASASPKMRAVFFISRSSLGRLCAMGFRCVRTAAGVLPLDPAASEKAGKTLCSRK